MNSENPTDYDRGKATGVKLGALIERRRIIALLQARAAKTDDWVEDHIADLAELIERKENA